MKAILLSLLLASSAAAQVSPYTQEALTESLATRDAALILQEQNKRLIEQLATSKKENVDQIEAYNGQIADRDKTIKSQKKTLNSPWVRFILAVRTWFYVIVGGIGFYVLLAIVTGIYGAPGTAVAKFASALIRFPFGWIRRIIDVFNPTMRVRAEQVPIVSPPAVVTSAPEPTNAEIAQRLAAMPESIVGIAPAPVAPPTSPSVLAQAFYGTRTVGEILQGVGRGR